MQFVYRLALLFLVAVSLVHAQEGYRFPSRPLKELVDAPSTPRVLVAPGRQYMALLARTELPGIGELAQPELRLAGLRWNPATWGGSRSPSYAGLEILPIRAGAEGRRVDGLPKGARILHAEWSREGGHLAVTVEREDRIELWLVGRDEARAVRVEGVRINSVLCDPLAWIDDRTLVALCVPEEARTPPRSPIVPSGPSIQESGGRKSAARTYQDLLASRHDEELFEHYARSEIVLVGTDGRVRRLGRPALHTSVQPAPGGQYLLIGSLRRPFSYLVPSTRFPARTEVIDLNGATVHVVAELPLNENMTGNAVRPGPRQVSWRADESATLSWIESLTGASESEDSPASSSEDFEGEVATDEAPAAEATTAPAPATTGADQPSPGADKVKKARKTRSRTDGKSETARMRDAWYTLAAPFAGKPVELLRLGYRVQSVTWCDSRLAFVTEDWRTTRRTRTWRVDPSRPGTPGVLLWDRSTEDRYGDPGRPATTRNVFGRLVALRSADGRSIFLQGLGASPEGDRPFLDRMDLETATVTRLWRSAPPWYEEFVSFLDAEGVWFLTLREAADTQPNYCIRNLREAEPVQLTRFPHPHPQFSGVAKELIKYRRADGVALSGTLYLPAGYKTGSGPLPTLLWAYPREYLSAEAAEQVKSSPHRFVRIGASGPLPLLLSGYAVLSDPAMPIIGAKEREPNDTYVEQLVASAQAAVDELVRRGVAKPGAIAVGGHSYGAFMTANLLVHTRLFAAGIARSGAYNRTLTPFGFQSEQRSFWKVPEVYAAMSPFNHADRVKDPLLLIHGGADNNPGTFTLQSERFYAALKGHGAQARIVILPHEAHSYRARESILHVLWEMETWLDRHLKTPAGGKP